MKKLLLISIFFILFSISIIAQTPCPTITVNAPNSQTNIGDLMKFTAKIEGINTENLKYKWIVSSGEIISGQGTLTINVATTKDMAGSTSTATFEVIGLPQDCPNEFSGWGDIEALPIRRVDEGRPFEYGKKSWRNEKLILNNIAKSLKNDNGLRVIFRISILVENYSQPFKTKSARIKNYLVSRHRIAKDRIYFIFGGNKENLTEIYFVPAGFTIPF